MRRRIDCHVHLDAIGGRARPSVQPGPTTEQFSAYVDKHQLDAVWGIFETEASLDEFCRFCPIVPLYWVRDPSRFEINARARGVKLHPYRDGWVISPAILTRLLSSLRPHTLVLIHCDDRTPETIAATRPSLIAPLAGRFPHLQFIIGHSGSYSPNLAKQPRATAVAEETTARLVAEAIEVAKAFPNAYLDTSVLVSPVKADLLAATAPVEKLLIGTDFPIGCYRQLTNFDQEEQALGTRGISLDIVSTTAATLTERAGVSFRR